MTQLSNDIPGSSVERKLSISGESVQRIYNDYVNNSFYVNRRYQRKLVWNIEEKRAFIDSILRGFPVPIILLAKTEKDKKTVFEIIDGMQRLNAIISFIEGEFDINDKYFDLQTMVESKSLLDLKKITQQQPVLERIYCEIIATYTLPISIYSFDTSEKIDEVFRRINSNGKFLSKQELRSAGATGQFPNLVRIISSEIRTDASATDILRLNDMKQISINNKKLEYGIKIDDIFWIKNNILTKEMLRQSRDEEIIANIVSYMVMPNIENSSASILDEYYGFKKSDKQGEIETRLTLKKSEIIKKQFITIYDMIRQILNHSNQTFNRLICDQGLSSVPGQFQIIFLSFYELFFNKKMEISNYDQVITNLININNAMDIPSGKTWSHQNKKRNIAKVTGILLECFKTRNSIDPCSDSWITEFETLLTQSKTEQNLYDFKQGFTKLDGSGEFDQDNFVKIIKTLTAMANHSPNAIGHICVGVTDNNQTAQRIQNLYNIQPLYYKNFKITGIEHEALNLQGNLDKFFNWLVQQIKTQPIQQSTKDNIGRNIKLINYYDKDVVLFSINAGKEPTPYGEKFYQRIGANLDEIKFAEYGELFKRFSEST